MEINSDAPIKLRHEIDIFAPPEKVWQYLSRIDLWDGWHPDIKSAQWTDDEPMTRRGFKFRAGLFQVKSRMVAFEEPLEIGWEGRTWWTRSRQVFRLNGDHRKTTVASESSFEGRPVTLLASRLSEPLDRFGQTWLAALKTNIESESETGARSPGTRRQHYRGTPP